MVWSIVALEAASFTALFTALVLLPSIKHPEAGVHNYPPEIQDAYFKTHPRVPTAPLSGRTIAIQQLNISIKRFQNFDTLLFSYRKFANQCIRIHLKSIFFSKFN